MPVNVVLILFIVLSYAAMITYLLLLKRNNDQCRVFRVDFHTEIHNLQAMEILVARNQMQNIRFITQGPEDEVEVQSLLYKEEE
jgi:DNA-binding LytR/AlgR family response regulator